MASTVVTLSNACSKEINMKMMKGLGLTTPMGDLSSTRGQLGFCDRRVGAFRTRSGWRVRALQFSRWLELD
jgi:hypothetical protein